jgi:CheY-like chemotaxis protein
VEDLTEEPVPDAPVFLTAPKASAPGDLLIIAMRTNAMKGDPERRQSAGMDGYIRKRLLMQELWAVIERIVSTLAQTLQVVA